MNAPGLPTFTWPASATTRNIPCPQCGTSEEKSLLVSVAWRTEDQPDRLNEVLACPACGAAFYDHFIPADYTDANIAAAGRTEFYLQQGTSLWNSAKLLARLGRPPGTRYLEVGCGVGFGLDFAIHGLGWHGQGYDPSPIAEIGRARLAVPIQPAYFTGAPAGSEEIILAAEVIEHVAAPGEFLALLRDCLAPGGVVVLTTPDAAAIRPDTSSGALVPLLSPGLHLVLQTERSLADLLQKSGFAHVTVERDGNSLIAFASPAPLILSADHDSLRTIYRAWLTGRAAAFGADRSLFFAFAGHAFSESVNDDDRATAQFLLPDLSRRLKAEFAIDLDQKLPLPPAVATASLARLAELMPLNLPAILLARAFLRLGGGEPRSAARPLFLAAGAAARALRRVLAEQMLEDGETEMIEWTAGAEILLCDAELAATDLPGRLASLSPAPGDAAGTDRRLEIVHRCFTGLVNADRIRLAETLAAAEGLPEQARALLGPASLSTSQRDMLFCLGIVALNGSRKDPSLAEKCFARVRAALPAGAAVSDLYWASLRGEVLAVERAKGSGAARALLERALAGLGSEAADAPPDLKQRFSR